MEFFRLELEGIWQFEILEAQNSEIFLFLELFLSSTSSLSLFCFSSFFFSLFFWNSFFCLLLRVSLSFRLFFFFFFLDQQLPFENNEIRFEITN
jgi:hypothetical protein